MVSDIDLRRIRRKIYMSYFQDGLWDILLGLFLVSWGVVMHADLTWLIGALFVALYSMTWSLKRWLTYPRMGYVKVAEARRQKAIMVIAGTVLFLLGMAVFLLVFSGNRPDWLSDYFIFLFGCMIAIVVSLLAYWWSVHHWYGYAILIVMGVAFHQWLNAPLALSFIAPGAIVTLSGLILSIRFLRKYPKPIEEAFSEDQ